jgi:hypothetical protein
MRHTIRPLLTTAILAALVAGCVAYVPARHGHGDHGHRRHGHDHRPHWDDYDRWDRDGWRDGRGGNRPDRYR